MEETAKQVTQKSASPMVFSISVIIAFLLLLVIPAARVVFETTTAAHPFLLGFVKFALLATVGELIAIRLTKKAWLFPSGVVAKACIWGFIGMAITLLFKIFAGGVQYVMQLGLFPFSGRFFAAFLCSVIMNLTFAPTMMLFHKMTDTAVEMKCKGQAVSLMNVVQNIDFKPVIGFSIATTIPWFWIPAHTITFLLPGEYQIVVAASLSIALGIILSLKKS